jgi:hypothetical protein
LTIRRALHPYAALVAFLGLLIVAGTNAFETGYKESVKDEVEKLDFARLDYHQQLNADGLKQMLKDADTKFGGWFVLGENGVVESTSLNEMLADSENRLQKTKPYLPKSKAFQDIFVERETTLKQLKSVVNDGLSNPESVSRLFTEERLKHQLSEFEKHLFDAF